MVAIEHMLPCSGGGQLTRRPHALSYDGESVILCNSHRLCVYSTLSGERIYDLHGHVGEVTGVCLHPRLKNQMYSCSRDGSMKLWNLDDGSCICTWTIPGSLPIEDMVVAGDVAYVTYFWRNSDAGRVLAFDLIKGEAKEMRVKLSTPRSVVCSGHDGDGSVVATYDRHTILVWESGSFGRRFLLALHHTKAFTCVSVSRDGTKIAAGDVSGRILIWHDIREAIAARMARARTGGDDEDEEPWAHDEPPAATVHWHAHAVGCVEFSGDGRYLLSGGQEAVLVLWDILSGSRGYFPRLGGPIVGISSCRLDPSIYCLRQADNTVRVVNIASMVIECSIHGVRPLPDDSMDTPLIIEPSQGQAVIPGPHSILQFYDIYRDVHVDRLQLSRRNIISMTESSTKTARASSVYRVVSSDDANLLVSVERHSDVVGSQCRDILKFWDRCPEESRQYGSPYVLNTVSENPHRNSAGDGLITDIAVHTSTRQVVGTASNSGDFALWSFDDSESSVQGRATKAWRKIIQVPGHRGDPLTCIAFSSEGGLVAVAGDQRSSGGVSLWDSSAYSLLGEFPSAFKKGTLQHDTAARNYLFFIRKSPFLVLACSSGIVVYNILSLSIVWCADVSGISHAVSDPGSRHWGIVLENRTSTVHACSNDTLQKILLVFNGSEKKPTAGWLLQQQRSACANPEKQGIHSRSHFQESMTKFSNNKSKIAFLPPGTMSFESVNSISVPGASPIVVFSHDREFSTAVSPDLAHADDLMERIADNRRKGSVSNQNFKRDTGSAYTNIFGTDAKTDDVGTTKYGPSLSTTAKKTSLFHMPSQALPPVANLCQSFLENILES